MSIEKYLGWKENIILDSINEGVFTVDLNWRITSFNQAAKKITGVKGREALGKLCYDVFQTDICEKNCALRRTLSANMPRNFFPSQSRQMVKASRRSGRHKCPN